MILRKLGNCSRIGLNFLTSTVYICIAISIQSCSNFVVINPPQDKINTNTVFRDSANATAAIIGLYTKAVGTGSAVSSSALGGSWSVDLGLSSDELFISGTSVNPSEAELYANSLSNLSSLAGTSWRELFAVIYHANACIEGVSNSGLSLVFRERIIGEAKFFRALSYFYLVNIYGDVPLILTTDYRKNAVEPRSNQEAIYQQMVLDLEYAEKAIEKEYVTNDRLRVNKHGVRALLARVYLYQQRWEEAEQLATSVIAVPGLYQLESDLDQVFSATSREAILQFQPLIVNQGTPEGKRFNPRSSSAVPNFGVTAWLLDLFADDDYRSTKWINKLTRTVGGQVVDYLYPYKFKYGQQTSLDAWSQYTTPLRLAEQYLIRAECRARQGNLLGANSAESDLNAIRNRAGLTSTVAVTEREMLDAILEERRKELFCEWGHRWLDLKRTGRVDEVMAAVTPQKGGTWHSNWQFYPIPLSELDTNPFLTQNTGY